VGLPDWDIRHHGDLLPFEQSLRGYGLERGRYLFNGPIHVVARLGHSEADRICGLQGDLVSDVKFLRRYRWTGESVDDVNPSRRRFGLVLQGHP
jgi:hypothetical protein